MSSGLPGTSSEEGRLRQRFVTSDLGNHTAEYDTADGTLRLSWSGNQTFLTQEEARRLRDLLCRITASSEEEMPISDLAYVVRYGDEEEGEARARTLSEVQALIREHVDLGDQFEITFLDGATKIGYGWYERGQGEHVVIEETRAAKGLMKAINALERKT